jgi:hypothetical protein
LKSRLGIATGSALMTALLLLTTRTLGLMVGYLVLFIVGTRRLSFSVTVPYNRLSLDVLLIAPYGLFA